MNHAGAFVVAILLFALASVLLYLGRAAIGTSTPLLVTIVGGYLLSLIIAFPVIMRKALEEIVAWYRAWKAPGPSAPGGPS